MLNDPHSADVPCPGCRRRQDLLNKTGILADRHRHQAEALGEILYHLIRAAAKEQAQPVKAEPIAIRRPTAA